MYGNILGIKDKSHQVLLTKSKKNSYKSPFFNSAKPFNTPTLKKLRRRGGFVGFLDALSFKKKKTVPLKELELPPPANEVLATGYNELDDIPPYREVDTPHSSQLQQFPIPFDSFMQKEQPTLHGEDFSAPFSFDHPRNPSSTLSGLSDVPKDIPMPLPFEMEMSAKQMPDEHHEEQHPEQLSLFSKEPMTSQFRFYESQTQEENDQEQHNEQHEMENIPGDFDIAKEFLAVPKQEKQIISEQKKEFVVVNKKQFIPVTILGELGEQLFHLQDDLSLAKDTAFRVADLNEQEIEQLAKWQTLCNSMELRFAEVDKILFKI